VVVLIPLSVASSLFIETHYNGNLLKEEFHSLREPSPRLKSSIVHGFDASRSSYANYSFDQSAVF
jgi:hypothetical protein